jgi:DNA polymerase-3 subunit chi
MTEVFFYHLERQPLETVLPQLLEKALARGWRAVVQIGIAERVEAISTLLWSYRDESFLPHGTQADGNAARQPIWLTDGEESPNAPHVRFFLDGAEPSALQGLERAIIMFDGSLADSVDQARDWWRRMTAEGHAVSYWRQDEGGRWRNMAERSKPENSEPARNVDKADKR